MATPEIASSPPTINFGVTPKAEVNSERWVTLRVVAD